MSPYKKGPKKVPTVVEIVDERNERPLPPKFIKTYHPRKGWIITEVKNEHK